MPSCICICAVGTATLQVLDASILITWDAHVIFLMMVKEVPLNTQAMIRQNVHEHTQFSNRVAKRLCSGK